MKEMIKDLVLWLKHKVKEANCKGVVFGLSGGVDSAVVAGISKMAFGQDALAVIMPCHSSPEDEEHALLVKKAFDLTTIKVDLSSTYDALVESLPNDDNKGSLSLANIKPRLRMTSLYYFAQEKKYLVLGCSNLSEFTIGYFTKYGDSGADLLPIASFSKHEIWDIASLLGVPEIIINKAPSAGLWSGQSDEEEMGFSYKELDDYINGVKINEEVSKEIYRREANSLHKKNFPEIYQYKKK